MRVTNYEEKTKERVVAFLKARKEALTEEIVRLGSNRRIVNWESLMLILEDLRREGKVRSTRLGKHTVVYEWVGET